MSIRLQIQELAKRKFIYQILLCAIFFGGCLSKLHSELAVMCEDVNPERTRTAYVIAAATVVALAAGIGYAASTSCSDHHDSYSSRSHYSYSREDNSSYSAPYSVQDYSQSSSTSFQSFYDSGSISSSGRSVTNPLLSTAFPLRSRKNKKNPKTSENSNELSGSFILNPSISGGGTGTLTAYVGLPNGSTQIVGNFSLAEQTSRSFSCGPFTELGGYVFGIKGEGVSDHSSNKKICTFEMRVNDSKTQTYDFTLPIGTGEPSPYHYTLSE